MIKVYKNYYLDADKRQVIVTKKKKNKKEEVYYEQIGYFMNVSDALYLIYKLEVNRFIEKNDTSLHDLILFIKKIEKELKSLVNISLEDEKKN